MKHPRKAESKITKKMDFTESHQLQEQAIDEANADPIKQASHFNQAVFLPTSKEEQNDEKATIPQSKASQASTNKSGFSKTQLMLFCLLALVSAESIVYITELIADFDVLDAAWLGFFLIIFGSFVTTTVTEFRSLRLLRKAEATRKQSHYLLNSDAIGNASGFCQKLCSPLKEYYSSDIEKWRNAVLSHHTNREVVTLFDDIVISQADKKAIHIVRKQVAATAALIGVSPLAAVDMMIVFVRHWQMINQISKAYGLRLGYSAKVRLLKRIVKHMIVAGSSEILLEASVYALGSSITAKVSTKVAQGLGAGALTGRLGLQIMAQCRPVEWESTHKPTLTSLTSHILDDLRKM